MPEVSKKLYDKGFIRRLNKITKTKDAFTNVVYHDWANARSKVCPRQQIDDNMTHNQKLKL